jgi:hypothetical protein
MANQGGYDGGLRVKSMSEGGLTNQLKAFNGGQPAIMKSATEFNPNAYGDKMMGQGIINAGKAMQSAMSQSTYSPSPESRFNANAWQDIGGGEQGGLASTGMAGASMNLYIQKMMSNPAIMQLLQQRMSQQNTGATNGSQSS